MLGELDFSEARIVCLASPSAEARVKKFIRIETGESAWNGHGGELSEIGFCAVRDFRDAAVVPRLLQALSEEFAPYLITLFVDPSLNGWSGIERLAEFLRREERTLPVNVLEAVNWIDFESRVSRVIKSFHLGCEQRLASVLLPEIERFDVASWKRLFSDAGCSSFAPKILPCIRALSVGEIARRLRLREWDGSSRLGLSSFTRRI